jgi:hypothetical protein
VRSTSSKLAPEQRQGPLGLFGLGVAAIVSLNTYWWLFGTAILFDGPGIRRPWVDTASELSFIGAFSVLGIAIYRGGSDYWLTQSIVVAIIVSASAGYMNLGERVPLHRWLGECNQGDARSCRGAASMASALERPKLRCTTLERGCRTKDDHFAQWGNCRRLLEATCITPYREVLACQVAARLPRDLFTQLPESKHCPGIQQ